MLLVAVINLVYRSYGDPSWLNRNNAMEPILKALIIQTLS